MDARCQAAAGHRDSIFQIWRQPASNINLSPFWFLFCERAWTKGHGVVYRSYVGGFYPWGRPSEGSVMKRLFASALLVLGSTCVARAQVTAPILTSDRGNA